MTARRLALAAAAGSALLLAGALAFQYLGGLAPCPLCVWQRWPHGIAAALGLVALAVPAAAVLLAGALAAAATAGIGVYHMGVERGWWPGPDTCAAGGEVGGMSTDALMDQIMSAPVVRCNEVAWEFAGLSMAGWNAALSAVLAAVWVGAYALKRRGRVSHG